MKYVVWGAGIRGKIIFEFLGVKHVTAFIESDVNKIGTYLNGIKIISREQYQLNYMNFPIIVSATVNEEIIEELEKNNIFHYFILNESPSELLGYGNKNVLEQLFSNLTIDKKYAIYGLTLFGMLLYEYLLTVGVENVLIAPHISCSEIRVESIRKIFNSYKIQRIEHIDKEVDEILLVLENDDISKYFINSDIIIKNAFDFSEQINDYYNGKIERYKDFHKGKRCFIVATGPSLRMEDLELLNKNNEICFSMNRVYVSYEETTWRPDYYVVTDRKMLKYNEEEIKCADANIKFISDLHHPFWEGKLSDNLLKMHVHYIPSNTKKPKFSQNPAWKVYEGSTVTYACIQLALYMGFEKIYLLGVDFNYSNNIEDKSNHFHKEYAKVKEKTGKVYFKEMLLAYQSAKEYADVNNVKIFNATRGGKLEVFERVDFDSLFE